MSLADVVKRADAIAQAMVSSARTKGTTGDRLIAGPGASVSPFGQNTPALRRERLRHFVGLPAALTRVCAQKIASQPLHVARKAKAVREPMERSSRSLKAKRIAEKAKKNATAYKQAPAFVKQLAEGVELLDAHPLLEILSHPNDLLTGWQTLFLTVASLEFEGEAYWFIDRSGDRPAIYFLSADWVAPVHTQDQLFASYKILVWTTGHGIDVDPADMVRFHVPNLINPYATPLSTLTSNAVDVVTDERIRVAQQRTMENGIFPWMGLVIGRHPDVAGVPGQRPILTKEQRATLTAAIKQAYKGALNAGEPILLDGLIEDVKQLTLTPTEMAFKDSSGITKERIALGWLTNPIIMGQVEGVNRASATIASENWYANKVNPLMELISEGLTRQLAPRLGEDDLLVWLEHAQAFDPDAKRADIDQLIRAKAITVNELREMRDLPPLDGPEGDALVSASSLPADPNGNGGAADNRSGTFRLKRAQRFRSVWAEQHRATEEALIEGLQKVFDAQAASVAHEIRQTGLGADPIVYLRSGWAEALLKAARSFLEIACYQGAVTELKFSGGKHTAGLRFKSDDSLEDVRLKLPGAIKDKVDSFLDSTFRQPFWSSITQSVQDDLAKALKEATDAGDNLQESAARVQAALQGAGKARAQLISRTESTGSLNAGHQAAREHLETLGVIKGKEWICIEDADTRPTHLQASGQQVNVKDDFTVGGEKASYPGDQRLSAAERCNCRCSSLSILKEEDEL